MKTKYVKQPYGENVRNVHGNSCTEAGDRTRGLRHMGQKRNQRLNVKLVRCKSCGSYKPFVTEYPDRLENIGNNTSEKKYFKVLNQRKIRK